MPLAFDFFNYSELSFFLMILWVITYVFFVLGCIKLRKGERESKYISLLLIIGICVFSYNITTIFIPRVRSVPPLTSAELNSAFVYDFTMGNSLNNAFLVLLGISFVYFGLKNRELSGYLLILAGIILIVSSIVSLISDFIYYYLAWFIDWWDPTPLTAYVSIFEFLTFFQYILLFIFSTLIIFFGVKIKQLHFVIFSGMFLGIMIFNFILFLV